MNKALARRLFVLGVLVTCLVALRYADFPSNAIAPVDSCEPCINCSANTICYPCAAPAKASDFYCEDGSRLYTCSGVCKPPGSNSCSGDVPICEEGIAVCHGGTWDCDNRPYEGCDYGPPVCPPGASSFCYMGTWYCTNNGSCSPTPPLCPQGEAVCFSGLWHCPTQ